MILYLHVDISAVAPARPSPKAATETGFAKGTAPTRKISVRTETPDAMAVLKPWLEAWTARGWKVLPSHHADMLDLRVPMHDTHWHAEIKRAIDAGAITMDNEPLLATPEFDQADHDAAAMFTLFHHGRLVEVPIGKDKKAGIAHVADFDDSRCCPRCGAGVVQDSPLRIAASELDRCGRMGSLWYACNTFYLLADELVRTLEKAVGEPLPKRAVEATGKRAPKQRWWQLIPEVSLPADGVRAQGVTPAACEQRGCGRPIVREYAEPAHMVHHLVRSKLPRKLPVVAWAPEWGGELMKLDDGRIFAAPQPLHLLLRRDLALAWIAEKVHGAQIEPVMMEE
jgi:hypothetical protein